MEQYEPKYQQNGLYYTEGDDLPAWRIACDGLGIIFGFAFWRIGWGFMLC